MRLQVAAYGLDGLRLGTLEEARAISFSNDETLTFSLPKTSADVAYFDDDIALAVEIEALANVQYGPLQYTFQGEVTSRFIYSASTRSRTEALGIWTFTARNIGDAVFPTMPILPELAHTTTYGPTATPASIIGHRVLEAKNRGADYGISVYDGGGWTTPNVATNLAFDKYADLGAFYTALKTGKHAELFWVGRTLYVLPPGTMTLDRADVVEFQLTDFKEVPVSVDRSNMADTVLALGENGTSALYPAAAPGKVAQVQVAGISDLPTLGEVAEIEWAARQKPVREITATLALGKDPLLFPFRDYHVGTIVTYPGENGQEEIGVAQITLTRDTAPDFDGNMILDTKIKSREIRLVELGKLGVGGVTAVSGNGTVLPDIARSTSGIVPINAAGVPGAASGSIVWTLKAGWMEVVVNVTSSTGWVSGVDYTIVAAGVIPYLPQTAPGARRGATFLVGGFVGTYSINIDGTVRVFHTTAAARTFIGFTVAYPI